MKNKLQILLVDDDETDRFLFNEALKQIGDGWCDLLVAKNGQQALNNLVQMHRLPDLIFLDINMPVMDGIECLQQLKAETRLMAIPVIILTTSVRERDRQNALKLGAFKVAGKAMLFDGLVTEIKNCLAELKLSER